MPVRTFSRFLPALPIAFFATIGAVALQPMATPFKATSISFQKANASLGEVANELSKASNIPIALGPGEAKLKCPAAFAGIPFWEALEQAARQTKTKVVLLEKGSKVGLEPLGPSKEIVAVSGPFRIAVKRAIGRALLELGTTVHELDLEVNWEPRIAVYRLDNEPHIVKAIDDRGLPLAPSASTASGYPNGATSEMRIKLNGLMRESKQIASVVGDFRVTAAEKILAFKFDNLNGKLPISKEQTDVKVTLKSISRQEKYWEVDCELLYPESQPHFESFEELKWLRDNKLTLVSPNGKPFEPESEEAASAGRRGRISVTYRFAGSLDLFAKGWSLVCETPSPLAEFKVPFELKNIPLP